MAVPHGKIFFMLLKTKILLLAVLLTLYGKAQEVIPLYTGMPPGSSLLRI